MLTKTVKTKTKKLPATEDGFTLIETLLTLTIVSVLLLFPILSIQEATEKTQIDLFLRELTAKITQLQNHALLYNQRTDVQFYPRNNLIRFRVVDAGAKDEILGEIWQLDNPHYKLGGTAIKEFAFKKGTGNITKSDRVYIQTTQGEYELVYLMGSGRFEIRKR